MIKIGAFLKIELDLSYGHHKKLKSFRNWFHSKKVSYFKENTNKVMIYQFLTEKSIRLDIFDREFHKISNIKPKIKLPQKMLRL